MQPQSTTYTCQECGVEFWRRNRGGNRAPRFCSRACFMATDGPRLWSKVSRQSSDGCWGWLAGIGESGYGSFAVNGRHVPAHRHVYELLVGPIPTGLDLDHLCRNRACVNPAHLEPVTRRENLLRGETIPARFAVRTHCQNGHLLDEANIYQYGNQRLCRLCRQHRDQQRRPRRRR